MLPHVVRHLQVLSEPLLRVTCWPAWGRENKLLGRGVTRSEPSTRTIGSVSANVADNGSHSSPETTEVYLEHKGRRRGERPDTWSLVNTEEGLWLFGIKLRQRQDVLFKSNTWGWKVNTAKDDEIYFWGWLICTSATFQTRSWTRVLRNLQSEVLGVLQNNKLVLLFNILLAGAQNGDHTHGLKLRL